jgi:bacillithiol biosynthesis deacetylase BshB1
MKLDILAFGAHPDDIELACAGTIIKAIKSGKKAGIIDLTEGQLGTRGTAELRLKEANKAAKIMGVEFRESLGMMDGFFKHDDEHMHKIIVKIRQYQPYIVLCNPPYDRHPDHGRASKLVSDACFYAGLKNIESELDGKKQEPYRPAKVFYYMQHFSLTPSFLVDISEEMEQKMDAVKAFSSQFYDPNSKEPETVLTSPDFLKHIYERSANWGYIIGAKYAEGFMAQKEIFGVNSIFDIKV